MTDQPQQAPQPLTPEQMQVNLDRAQIIIDRLRAKLTEANEHIVSLEADQVMAQRRDDQQSAVIQGMAQKIAELTPEQVVAVDEPAALEEFSPIDQPADV